MSGTDNLAGRRENANTAYWRLIAPMHDWRHEGRDRVARQIEVAARLKDAFGLKPREDHARLGEFLSLRIATIRSLSGRTIVLLRYLLEDVEVSWSVFLEDGLTQMKGAGRETYMQTYVLDPVGA